jgi:hypothetical protein
LAISSVTKSEHHTSVDSEIELLESLIALLVQKHAPSMTTKNADEIAKVAQKLGNLKKIKMESMKREQLDSEVVGKFLRSVLGVIKIHTSQQTAKMIIGDIITNVAVPMMHKNEMTDVDEKIFKRLVTG